MKKIYILRYMIDLPKTIYYNFRYLPFKQAIYLPMWVNRSVKIKAHRGGIKIHKLKSASVKFGVSRGAFNRSQKRSYLRIWPGGTLVVNGGIKICSGFAIEIGTEGELMIGSGFHSSGNMICTCNTIVKIGQGTLLGWDVIIRDSDGHSLFQEGERINLDKPIIIGKNVWIGAESVIMKGITIGDGCVVGMRAVVTHDILEKNSVSVGQPTRIIKKNIEWDYD